MEAGDPHVLAAMDGRELGPNDKPPAPNPANKEPTAFFFIIFGDNRSTDAPSLEHFTVKVRSVVMCVEDAICLLTSSLLHRVSPSETYRLSSYVPLHEPLSYTCSES